MTFDIATFVAGMVTLGVLQFITYHIVRVVELRAKEKEQWERVRSLTSPSQRYWMQQTEPQTSDVEESITIKPRSRTDFTL